MRRLAIGLVPSWQVSVRLRPVLRRRRDRLQRHLRRLGGDRPGREPRHRRRRREALALGLPARRRRGCRPHTAAAGGRAGAASGEKHAPEADIEAAAVFGGRIVWMSSNGRNGDGKVDRDRFQLFASHRLANDTWSEAFSRSFAGLPDAVAATTDASYEPLRKAVGDLSRPDPDLAPKEHGFNIEGLTATADGRFLLVGLRNPQPDDKAVLFRLDNAEDLLDGRTDEVALRAGRDARPGQAGHPRHRVVARPPRLPHRGRTGQGREARARASRSSPGTAPAAPGRSRLFGACWTPIPTSTPRPSCRCWSGPATRSSLRSGS